MTKEAAAETAQQEPGVAPGGHVSAERWDVEILIDQLREHPNNPRTSFDQAKLEELAQSIRSKGSAVDPRAPGRACGAGAILSDRRRRAPLPRVHDGGLEGRPLHGPRYERQGRSRDHADRKRPTRRPDRDRGGAPRFKNWLDIFGAGPQAFADLAKITGKSDTYIRRRVRVLEYPKEILDMWEKGN